MGVDDVVDVEDLAVQGYPLADSGPPKVETTRSACRALLPEIVLDLDAVNRELA